MKISYRITSGAVLGALALPIASRFLPQPSGLDPIYTGWEPCTVWVDYGPLFKFVLFLCLAGIVVFTIRGLRNRPGPRWLGIACVPALLLAILSESLRITHASGCYSKARLICWFTWLGVVMIMFLHHAVQPHTTNR